jgi:hypothetical protein
VNWVPALIRWSPDGRRLRFSVQDPRSLAYSIWEVQSDGTNFHPLLPGWNNPPAECCGNWTPDGVRALDRKVEQVASLKNIQQAVGTFGGSMGGLALDDAPLALREASSEEIYALDWEAP